MTSDPRTDSAAVDAVILTWNDGPLLAVAVDSVMSVPDVDVRIVVVDNASDEAPSLPADPTIALLSNPENRGVAAARNQGARVGSAPYILLLDSDAELEPGCLRTLVDTLERDPSIALAAPVFSDQAPEASGGHAPTMARKLARGLGLTAHYRPTTRASGAPLWDVDFTIGACQLIRRRAWDAVNGLDESYFYGPEDLDFCLRLKAAGFRVVQVAGAQCHHPPRRRNRSLFRPGGVQHARALLRHYARSSRTATS